MNINRKINRAKTEITMRKYPADSEFHKALEVALECMTLVQNIDAVYNASDSNESSIYVVQDILEKYFAKDGELC